MVHPPPSPLDAETLEPPKRVPLSLPMRVPVLTLAWHSDLRRIGERAVLAGVSREGGVALSRAEPSFLDARGRSTGPLSDPHVSRAPIGLSMEKGGLLVDASAVKGGVELDGMKLAGKRLLDSSELEAGVVLAISGSVLLVLRLAMVEPGARAAHGLLGASDAVDAMRRGIDIAATHQDAVLLLGESGTGKELLAAAIHQASARASGPYLAINMATLTGATAVAELFGHSRGAFTGAEGTHGGYFGRADGGTLFLDEIGDAPTLVQPMLLRALESGEISPVGGRGNRRVDVRVIAATDHDIHRAAAVGQFRLPLFHRLATHQITLPPLRDRREDILPLAVHFLREERSDADATTLPIDVALALLRAPWPGNVRELRNAARSLAREGPAKLLSAATASSVDAPPSETPEPFERGSEVVDDAKLADTLRRNGFRIGATARELGIARNTLYKRMEQCEGLRRARDVSTAEIEACAAACEGDLDAMAARLEVSARALQLRLRELGLEPLST